MSPDALQNLDDLLDSVVECFTPELARRLITLEATPALQARLEDLAEKANEGVLTPQENAEYAAYIEAGDVIGIFQAKARSFLEQQQSG